jgi:hypothetical protein
MNRYILVKGKTGRIMGDERRGTIFAQWIVRQFPKAQNILDVAGGKGQLARKLANKKRNVHILDAKPRFKGRDHPGISYQSVWFEDTTNVKGKFDLVVGMHPDEATGEIIRFAVKHYIPFAVVPCCIKGRDARGISKFSGWIKRLSGIAARYGYSVYTYQLRMAGKNLVIYGKPKKK